MKPSHCVDTSVIGDPDDKKPHVWTDEKHTFSFDIKVQLDAAFRVKKAIDDVITELLAEKNDDIKHKDFCVEEFNTNQFQTERKEHEKQDLLAFIEDIRSTTKTLPAEMLREAGGPPSAPPEMRFHHEELRDSPDCQSQAHPRCSSMLLSASFHFQADFLSAHNSAALEIIGTTASL